MVTIKKPVGQNIAVVYPTGWVNKANQVLRSSNANKWHVSFVKQLIKQEWVSFKQYVLLLFMYETVQLVKISQKQSIYLYKQSHDRYIKQAKLDCANRQVKIE